MNMEVFQSFSSKTPQIKQATISPYYFSKRRNQYKSSYDIIILFQNDENFFTKILSINFLYSQLLLIIQNFKINVKNIFE